MQQAVSLEPDLGVGHFYLSHALFYQEQPEPERALESYDKAISLQAGLKDIGYWIELQEAAFCRPFIQAKAYDKAIAVYENILKELEQDEFRDDYYRRQTYTALADVYHTSGDGQQAIVWYEKALDLVEPWKTGWGLVFYRWECGPLHESLARLYTERGDTAKARFHQDRAAELIKKDRMITSYFSAVSASIGISFLHLLGLGIIIVGAGCHLLLLKIKRRRAGQQSPAAAFSWNVKQIYTNYIKVFFAPSTTVAWGIRDIGFLYLLCFFFPVVLLIPIYCVLMVFDLDVWFFASLPNLAVMILLGGLGVFLYWRSVIPRFQKKFARKFPESSRIPAARSHSLALLSFWQILCLVGINIALVLLSGKIAAQVLWAGLSTATTP